MIRGRTEQIAATKTAALFLMLRQSFSHSPYRVI